MCFVGNEDKEGGRFEIYFGNITTRWIKNDETTKSVINYLPRCTHHLIYFGHQVFYLFCPLVLIFGRMVFIYSVVQLRYNVPISFFKVCLSVFVFVSLSIFVCLPTAFLSLCPCACLSGDVCLSFCLCVFLYVYLF